MRRKHRRFLRSRNGGSSADDIYLIVYYCRQGRTPFAWHRRKPFPRVGGWLIFPCIIDRYPARRPGFRKHEASEGVNLVAVGSEGDMMRRKRHRFPLQVRETVPVSSNFPEPKRRTLQK